ncbi:hypothetical protein BCV70DRAFT_79288 [Testicularia cyperi]|uniref:Uncharacterized protein n=1 Tax=Testicularia cyperi TaxID=1882483 RepID=A0A317XV12_9BASI|nr:hypothetical protein BCV70DRAFT_79288 [Testicularia cyperi]
MEEKVYRLLQYPSRLGELAKRVPTLQLVQIGAAESEILWSRQTQIHTVLALDFVATRGGACESGNSEVESQKGTVFSQPRPGVPAVKQCASTSLCLGPATSDSSYSSTVACSPGGADQAIASTAIRSSNPPFQPPKGHAYNTVQCREAYGV